MAFLRKCVVAAAALASIVGAVPMNLPRDVSTVTETTYTTVDVTVKLIVDQNGVPLQTVVPSGTTTIATSSANVAVAAAVTTTSVAAAPPTTLVAVVPKSSTADPVAIAPSPSSVVAASGGTGQILATTTNSCTSQSDACLGQITHYDGGQSACGPVIDSNTVMGIALPWEFMGPLSNTNPYCGKSLTIFNPGTGVQVQAYVVDKCMGCTGRSIDLTNAAFNAVAPACNGRCDGFEWWFN